MRTEGPLPTAISSTLAGLRLLAISSREPCLPNCVQQQAKTQELDGSRCGTGFGLQADQRGFCYCAVYPAISGSCDLKYNIWLSRSLVSTITVQGRGRVVQTAHFCMVLLYEQNCRTSSSEGGYILTASPKRLRCGD